VCTRVLLPAVSVTAVVVVVGGPEAAAAVMADMAAGSTAHIFAVWSAEQVARCRTSGERRTRVMYLWWA
jgi:hypothetical protein